MHLPLAAAVERVRQEKLEVQAAAVRQEQLRGAADLACALEQTRQEMEAERAVAAADRAAAAASLRIGHEQQTGLRRSMEAATEAAAAKVRDVEIEKAGLLEQIAELRVKLDETTDRAHAELRETATMSGLDRRLAQLSFQSRMRQAQASAAQSLERETQKYMGGASEDETGTGHGTGAANGFSSWLTHAGVGLNHVERRELEAYRRRHEARKQSEVPTYTVQLLPSPESPGSPHGRPASGAGAGATPPSILGEGARMVGYSHQYRDDKEPGPRLQPPWRYGMIVGARMC